MTIGIGILSLSAFYLSLFARDIMNSAAALAILLHIGLGLLLIIPVGLSVRRLYLQSAAESSIRRNAIIAAGLFAALCAFTGIYLTLRAAWGQSAAHDSWVGTCHIVTGVFALLLIIWRYFSGATKRKTRHSGAAVATKTALPSLSVLLLLLLFAQGALWGTAALLPEYNSDTYYRDLTATNSEQAANPLFPAGLRLRAADGTEPTSPVHWNLPTSESCGRSGCHPESFRQWQASGHHFAGTDVFYQSVLEQTAARSGRKSMLWCQGCHAPHAVLASSEPQAQKQRINDAEGEGVGCYSCHAAVGTPTRTGNGHFVLAEPQDYPFGNAVGWKQNLHDFLLRVRPGPHQRAYLRPELHASSEFCSNCHRQSFSVAQNHYQFVRGSDEFGEWQQSPFSGRAARASARNGQMVRTCQDCHFPSQIDGGFNHESPGGNTALPALRGDKSRVEQTETYLRGKIALDLFALRRRPSANQNEQWIAPLDSPLNPYSLQPGETWTLDILVTNRGVGHDFPSGYTDIKEAWLEIKIMDAAGRTVLANGVLQNPGTALPQDAHSYSSLVLNRMGDPIANHTLTEQVTTAYRRAIAPGSSDVARYSITVPRKSANGKPLLGPLQLSVGLRYRALRPDFARWALGAASDIDREKAAHFVPPITTLAETTLTLPMRRFVEEVSLASAAERRDQSERFVRYGTALLAPLEKPDFGGALRAFRTANELAPDRAEPLMGIGRVFLTEPDLRLAGSNLTMALQKDPTNSAAAADLSVVYNKQGQHEQAIQTLIPLLARYPQDGKLQFDFGIALFKAGRYDQAVKAYQDALAADPDDPAAHFQLKRCYEVMRQISDARREDSITRYLAEDKFAPVLIPRYLVGHPDARQSAQQFPVHRLRPVDTDNGGK